MTALDTTNLRITFTAPANGAVLVRLRGSTTGTTLRILLGVLEGSTVMGAASGMGWLTGLANSYVNQEAVFVVTGLSAGSHVWDAAYGVDILQAAMNLKYGGPNDTAGQDAWGAFIFEVWETTNLLAATFYNPSTAATAATTSLTAMTAFDTTNLRLTFTAPASGRVFWRLRVQSHGVTAPAAVLLGILESSTVVARVAPVYSDVRTPGALAVNPMEGSGVISGVSAGSHTYDAAYAIQVVSSAGALKWGGPNDTTTDNAFGGAAFDLWTA